MLVLLLVQALYPHVSLSLACYGRSEAPQSLSHTLHTRPSTVDVLFLFSRTRSVRDNDIAIYSLRLIVYTETLPLMPP